MISFSSVQSTAAAAAGSTGLLPHYDFHKLSFSLPSKPTQFRCYSHRRQQGLRIRAIDAAQPYDYEAYLINRFEQSTKLKIAVVGFGNFGQFLAKAFIRQGHTVFAHSRSDYASIAQSLGAAFFFDTHDLCEQHPDVILLCTSIISTESVLRSLPILRLKRNTLFVDVLSVKEFAKNVFLQVLPTHFDILCTHPMFGPESGKNGWQNLPFVYEKVRIGNEDSRFARVENFLDIFKKEGCRMVEMTCAEHDKYAAGSQFITHTMGRILEKLQLDSTPINTKGYETLLDLVENTASDSFDLYYGLFMYNKNAMEQIERLDLAFEALKQELFGHLHEVLRKQLFGKAEAGMRSPVLAKLPKNGTPLLPAQSETLENNDN
ncbi:arogenate dehydrogenase 2, chloroplastic-like [Olea europaea var. sylvestris]|uniref:Arogenate dehydrogenase 2, chloroplastic-like n=1 Tax=Olea europaea subsp. europaea TaxID=158383 RepID=A0A8S0T6U7_OLEEU|nr:arogenate dehydrogenase 2, chloroplastic-like [Olea europaea var. sylvestris]XP_022893398.1 arogenate dehydrogenase 2, chloroplastic-like [Olea europaea var. sylvestris]XP_022893399.1 arogenate dehydrogenase 2, chloroplastic-like [Olea europaea var. sylvestris]XP_022893400.1 arogenate dehydrogenase 2, chloroplastic-like [Olea europaea var. sylvestris]CAA3000677.1 arogenate dehydrogenase 2, chloroplastic-like [Olea europaea subsp. europaea]